jgi:deazaflavin-dependent oxidoreductase (nitroreductase family)
MNFVIRFVVWLNVALYKLTRGRLGGRAAGQSILLLHSTGRKSGKSYTTPLNFYRDGDNYVIVASNWGGDRHPGWFHNIMHQPRTTIQVMDKTIPVEARQVEGEEYERLWALVSGKNDYYVRYQGQTSREIPVVALSPVSQD